MAGQETLVSHSGSVGGVILEGTNSYVTKVKVAIIDIFRADKYTETFHLNLQLPLALQDFIASFSSSFICFGSVPALSVSSSAVVGSCSQRISCDKATVHLLSW